MPSVLNCKVEFDYYFLIIILEFLFKKKKFAPLIMLLEFVILCNFQFIAHTNLLIKLENVNINSKLLSYYLAIYNM